jgi:hypothetical protein
MRRTYQLIVTSLIFIISLAGTSEALEYTSYIFTTEDIILFSYEDGTQFSIYGPFDLLTLPFQQPVILDKGEHILAQDKISQGVYRVTGSNKFAVLIGDPNTEGTCGYYAMDADGLGTSTEFYTYVPEREGTSGYENQQFIVFGYEPNTVVTVQAEDPNGVYQDFATFTLDKGQHWTDPNLDNKYIHITADKPVSALTCYDQGYFVPSANGRWSGTEFYTYVSDIGYIDPWPEDLTVIAHHDDTSVTIEDSDTQELIWSGTLNNGDPCVVSYPQGADKYFTIESDKTVTVSVQPWKSVTTKYSHGVFIPERGGTGVGRTGRDIIGSCVDEGYLYVLAHTDNTHVDLYNSETGSYEGGYTLDRGQYQNLEPGNGLWRIVCHGYVSAYSGSDTHTAEFAPLAFDVDRDADFDNDGTVNFIDYAMFANAWQTTPPDADYNDIFDLEDNNFIDYADLALFVKDWLWQTDGTMMSSMTEMQQDFSIMVEPYQPAPTEQQPTETEPLDIEYMIKFLDEIWLDEEVRKHITEDEWLRFMESLTDAVTSRKFQDEKPDTVQRGTNVNQNKIK